MNGGIITKPQMLFGYVCNDDFVIPIPREGLPDFKKDEIKITQIDMDVSKLAKAIKKHMRKKFK